MFFYCLEYPIDPFFFTFFELQFEIKFLIKETEYSSTEATVMKFIYFISKNST